MINCVGPVSPARGSLRDRTDSGLNLAVLALRDSSRALQAQFEISL